MVSLVVLYNLFIITFIYLVIIFAIKFLEYESDSRICSILLSIISELYTSFTVVYAFLYFLGYVN
jgi:hypothetical protein